MRSDAARWTAWGVFLVLLTAGSWWTDPTAKMSGSKSPDKGLLELRVDPDDAAVHIILLRPGDECGEARDPRGVVTATGG